MKQAMSLRGGPAGVAGRGQSAPPSPLTTVLVIVPMPSTVMVTTSPDVSGGGFLRAPASPPLGKTAPDPTASSTHRGDLPVPVSSTRANRAVVPIMGYAGPVVPEAR
jgi:hypothetical protein